MKLLYKMEVYFPYFAILLFFITFKLQLSSIVYLILAIIIGLYFFPFRLLITNSEKRIFHIIFSVIFSTILIFSSVFLINPNIDVIKISLGFLGISCFILLIYMYFTKELSNKLFFLLLGFNILSGLYLAL